MTRCQDKSIRERTVFPTNGASITGQSHANRQTGVLSHITQKLVYLCDIRQCFLGYDTKGPAMKEITDRLNFIKM